MDAESFERIIHLLWADAGDIPRWWDASAALGPGPRTLQRWASGKNEIPDWMLGRVHEAIRKRGQAVADAEAIIAGLIKAEFERGGL